SPGRNACDIAGASALTDNRPGDPCMSMTRRISAAAAVALTLAASACSHDGGGPTTTTDAHAVSGSITPAATGAGATVTLGAKTATADANGAFSFTGVADGAYTVTPTKAGVTFTPATQSVTVKGADVTGVTFTAKASTGSATVSGTVHAAGGQVVDSDTADVNAPSTPNDSPATAQMVPSAVTVGGHAAAADDNPAVPRGAPAAGEVVPRPPPHPQKGPRALSLNPAANVDPPIAPSMGSGGSETVTTPAGGDYFVVVAAASGASNYVMT